MDNILYILLLPTVFILGIANSEEFCNGDNCNSTQTEATSSDESEMDLLSLDSDLRELLHMDGCSNLTILEHTPKLRILEIFNCSWYTINITQLSPVANLSILRMQGGRLVKLNSDQFAELPHLEILELGSNKIRVVPEDSFKGLFQLWRLTLNDNNIVTLHKDLFYSVPELRHLDLSNNRINGLPEDIFANNPKLEVFCLRGGRFLSLSPKALRPLRNLMFLDLSNNYLMHLQLSSAETIRLENSGMHDLTIEGKVSRLLARNNNLETLDIESKSAVIELDLHENSVDTTAISSTLQGMWRLQSLDISKNSLRKLPIFTKNRFSEVFLLPNLRFVNISKNWLKHLRADSPLLSFSLTHLDLSYNRIRSIEPYTFSMASKLQSLYLQGNLLVNFQYELFHHQQQGLKEVALYKNEFRQDIYEKIIKYFANAGVLVLEKNEQASLKIDTFNNDTFHTGALIQRVNPDRKSIEPATRQSAELNIFRKLNTWNILIILSLLIFLTLNGILILQHLHFSSTRTWRRKPVSCLNRNFSKI